MTARTMLADGRPPLILASQSRTRQVILAGAGIAFDALPADLDERAIEAESGLSAPGEVADRLACAKAAAVSALSPGRYVIGADQTLALGARRFSKPADRAAAAGQIAALAGRTHELHSAVAVVRDGEVLFSQVSVARMTMRPLGAAAIDAYLAEAGDAVARSVGAYQLEGLGVHLFERIEGDYFTILGLPLLPLLAFLRGRDLLKF
ncbi:MAG: Maf family protein [Xanthobacteraceae bacterium]|nr:Maf family protein [Xanthobacteraceae bacterium]